jgi:hypothetical protein
LIAARIAEASSALGVSESRPDADASEDKVLFGGVTSRTRIVQIEQVH